MKSLGRFDDQVRGRVLEYRRVMRILARGLGKLSTCLPSNPEKPEHRFFHDRVSTAAEPQDSSSIAIMILDLFTCQS